jgi:hypothetical protein
MEQQMQEILRQLGIAQQQAKEAEQRAENEREQRQRAEEQQQQAEQRVKEAEKRTQNTTFDECLIACQSYLQTALIVETDKSQTTKGTTTKITNKYHPKTLKHWAEYPDIQQQIFNDVRHIFHAEGQPEERIFHPTLYFQALGADLANNKIRSERGLEGYEKVAVEKVVTSIVNKLYKTTGAQTSFGLKEEMEFANPVNPLSDHN